MSRPQQASLTCPECEAEQPFTCWTSLNVSLNPQEKKELIAGKLTTVTCGNCGWSGEAVYPMLYHDMEKQLMVWLWPDAGDPDLGDMHLEKGMRDYRFRIVGSRHELTEKIFIFDEGLDDRVIEMLKLIVRSQMGLGDAIAEGQMFFVQTVDEGPKGRVAFEYVREERRQTVTVPFHIYEKLVVNAASKPEIQTPTSPWLRVGLDYGLAMMQAR